MSRSSHSRPHCFLGFDQFGFAVFRRSSDRWKQEHRSHDYSYPRISASKIEAWKELLCNWDEASTSCTNKIRVLLEEGVPLQLRCFVWKCLLGSDLCKETNAMTYQDYVYEIRNQLDDLGVNGYGVRQAISALCNADYQRGKTQSRVQLHLQNLESDQNPKVHIDVLRQIVLDVERSFPTHCSLMGENPEAKEGQAKLFRILSAYAKHNPQIGYCQGMSYIAAMLLINMPEEDAFWALVVLLEKPKYLAGFYEHSLDTIQRHAKIFQQLLKHRMPKLWQHMEHLEVAPLLFITTWFLTLFTSLPCWDSVLAVWDFIILDGIIVIYNTGLCILKLLEPRLLVMADVSPLLPTLLRIPIDISRYNVLVPALWKSKVHKWELDCMQSVVLEEEEERFFSGAKQQDTFRNTLAKMLNTARCYLQDLGHLPKSPEQNLSPDRSQTAHSFSTQSSLAINSKGQARIRRNSPNSFKGMRNKAKLQVVKRLRRDTIQSTVDLDKDVGDSCQSSNSKHTQTKPGRKEDNKREVQHCKSMTPRLLQDETPHPSARVYPAKNARCEPAAARHDSPSGSSPLQARTTYLRNALQARENAMKKFRTLKDKVTEEPLPSLQVIHTDANRSGSKL
ncbi:ecotropic viral integration site 5 protein homolog isoform X3 [Callorhinchus milii]|nr:ecotropic viral integration site 5 protein homolog isoform X3 [Callorhinchus milii]